MGAPHSLRNMLTRSLGAGDFSTFWKYWNPVWGYHLGKYVFKPLKAVFPSSLSLILTFVFCGFLHDVVIMIVRSRFTLLLTIWFCLMGIWVVVSEWIGIDYAKYAWPIRALINVAIIGICLLLTYQIKI